MCMDMSIDMLHRICQGCSKQVEVVAKDGNEVSNVYINSANVQRTDQNGEAFFPMVWVMTIICCTKLICFANIQWADPNGEASFLRMRRSIEGTSVCSSAAVNGNI